MVAALTPIILNWHRRPAPHGDDFAWVSWDQDAKRRMEGLGFNALLTERGLLTVSRNGLTTQITTLLVNEYPSGLEAFLRYFTQATA